MTQPEPIEVGGDVPPTLSESDVDAFYAVGRMLYERDDFDRAADVFRFVSMVAPTRSESWWALGACHEQIEDFEVAAALYETGFRLCAQPPDLGLLCARARARASDLAGAAEMLEELRELDLTTEQQTKLTGVETMLEGCESCR